MPFNRTRRAYLLGTCADVALLPGMNAAELAGRKAKIDLWIQANPHQAKALAKRVQDRVDSLAR